GARALRPDGVLVYATCTISSSENERLIAAFLDSHPGFALDDLAAELPALRLAQPGASRGREGFTSRASGAGGLVLTLPHRDHTAGFFIARLRPTNLPGRYRCVYCLHRFELTSVCPNCGEHSTIVRMSSTAILKCNNCGDSMLQPI